MTQTNDILHVTPASYREIREELRQAGYDHALREDTVMMDGIALKSKMCPLPEPQPELPNYKNLRWIDQRWHCGLRGIHAGDHLHIRLDNGEWMDVRIEGTDAGRWLKVYFQAPGLHGRQVFVDLYEDDILRWP